MSSSAFAQTTWQATATGDVAVTDNVFAAPNDSDREGDLFFTLRPGAVFTYNRPRLIQDLVAEAEVVQYAFHSKRPSLSARGGWRGFWIPGPRSEVNASLAAGTGILSSVSAKLTDDDSMIDIRPAGQITFRQASAGQSMSYVATTDLRVSQALFASWADSHDDVDESPDNPLARATRTSSAQVGGMLGFDRQFQQDSISFTIGAAVQRLERLVPPNDPMGSHRIHHVMPTGRVVWRHDIDRRLSFALDGGLVGLVPFGTNPFNRDQERQSGVFPVAGGAVTLDEKWGRAAMALRRDVAPNIFLAQNTISDNAAITAALPLPWLDASRMRSPRLAGVGLVGISRTRLIDNETAERQSTFGAARIDLGVQYTPRPGISYGVRYELAIQTGATDINMARLKGYFRNTVVFTFDVRYPDQLVNGVPKPRNKAKRADGRDRDTIGPEPIVPDLLDPSDAGDDR